MIIGKWNKSVIITYIGIGFAVLGMVLALSGKEIRYTLCCLIVSGVCDLFDGTYARHCKRTEEEKEFGIQIDSLADVMNFIALPIALSVGLGFHSPLHIVVYVLFTICGVARLAYFNMSVTKEDGPVKYYQGLPVTFTALILSTICILYGRLEAQLFEYIYIGVLFLIAVLNIFNIKIKKPRGIAYAFLSILAIILLLFYLEVINFG